jgi:ABC-type branched-subunit amino acid transport system substrate-binding protein
MVANIVFTLRVAIAIAWIILTGPAWAQEFRIGVLIPGGDLGNEIKEAAESAFRDLASAGPSENRYGLVIVEYHNPAEALYKASRLIAMDEVQAIVGPVDRPSLLALQDLIRQKNRLVFPIGIANSPVGEPPAPTVIPSALTDSPKNLTRSMFQILLEARAKTRSSNPTEIANYIKSPSGIFDTVSGKISFQEGRLFCPLCAGVICTPPKKPCGTTCCDAK